MSWFTRSSRDSRGAVYVTLLPGPVPDGRIGHYLDLFVAQFEHREKIKLENFFFCLDENKILKLHHRTSDGIYT